MRNRFVVDFAENAIIATKTTLKRAGVPNSPEYKLLMKLMKQNPDFKVIEKEIKKSEGKTTYKGLSKAFIEKYLSIQENAEELSRQYNKTLELGKFPQTRKWFLDTFKDFNMDEAKEEIDAAFIKQIKTDAEEKPALTAKQSRFFDMPAAVNQ